ncbi:Ig-like domain-containing protein [Herbidospora cretacea]|uniref:Ig-like domain-containing protein n=1 Tax=Herbidospora cretacea TaxID=28444 RepID=UPI000773CF9E|nr:Ig-like domain-containing protein [Herbidospora cretacea]
MTLEEAQAMTEQAIDTYEVDPADLILPEEEPEGPDETPPSVIETSPSAAAQNVEVATSVVVVFDEAVTGTVVTVKDPGGVVVAGETESTGEDMAADFTLAQPLTAGATYTGAQDLVGNAMAGPYSWWFTIGGGTPTPTPRPPPRRVLACLPLRLPPRRPSSARSLCPCRRTCGSTTKGRSQPVTPRCGRAPMAASPSW